MGKNPLLKGLKAVHPGALLREDVLPGLNKPVTEIAALLGVSRQTLHAVLSEKQDVTPEMALRLGKLLGNGPDLWLGMQCNYDIEHAEQELAKELKAIPTLQVA